jgi:hypothetical protein
MDESTKYLWGLFIIIAPWLTGGLAGALLTYTLNQRATRRKQARILVATERVDYSIAGRDKNLEDLRVSYNGRSYDSLLLFKITIDNTSTRTIKNSPILILFEKGTKIVDRSSLTLPTSRRIDWIGEEGQDYAYRWDAGELKPGDSASTSILLTPTTTVNWLWRGDDDVEVISAGHEGVQTFERELRNVIVWIALYVSVGVIPFFSSLAQGLLLIISMPFIVSYCVRWWAVLMTPKTTSPTLAINAVSSSVALNTGGGTATVIPPSTSGESGASR